MKKIFVLKSNGELAPFNPRKILKVCQRVGASRSVCREILESASREIYNGISTKEIFTLVSRLLKAREPSAYLRYFLKKALYKIGPAGFNFEKYIEKIFQALGYQTTLPPLLQGRCVEHEVDILAKKQGKTLMIECKFRHQPEVFINLKDALATWARFLDLKENKHKIDKCLIVSNARFSKESLEFCLCRGIELLGWNFPKENPLPRVIDQLAIYPITIFSFLNFSEIARLIKNDIITNLDLLNLTPERLSKTTGIDLKRIVTLYQLNSDLQKEKIFV